MDKKAPGIVALLALLSPALYGQAGHLEASDPGPGDRFGFASAVAGQRILVGAFGDDDNGVNSGSVYVFDASSFAQVAKLVAPNGPRIGDFGFAIAADGGLALIGAPVDENGGVSTGAAYVFDVATGAFQTKLLSNDMTPVMFFGESVGINGTTAIVGASGHGVNQPGAAYLFDTTTGNQLFKLSASGGVPGDHFGGAVALNGTTAIVGAFGEDGLHTGSGFVYLFDIATGAQIGKVEASDAAQGGEFGYSLAVDGDFAIIGARSQQSSGAAYLFDLSTQSQLAKLLPYDVLGTFDFGKIVSIRGTTAAVTGLQTGLGPVHGTAYLFDVPSTGQRAKLFPSDFSVAKGYGDSVAVGDNMVVVGASLEAVGVPVVGSAGAGYVFETTIQMPNTGAPFCFGDGTGASCPCGTIGGAGRGCVNSSGAGAQLSASGHASKSYDSFKLHVTGAPSTSLGLILRGLNQVSLPIADGILCTTGNSHRSHVQATVLGETTFDRYWSASISERANAGATENFQFWYRDSNNTCSGLGFNFSNAWATTWLP